MKLLTLVNNMNKQYRNFKHVLEPFIRRRRLKNMIEKTSYLSVVLDTGVAIAGYFRWTKYLYLFSYFLSILLSVFFVILGIYLVKYVIKL